MQIRLVGSERQSKLKGNVVNVDVENDLNICAQVPSKGPSSQFETHACIRMPQQFINIRGMPLSFQNTEHLHSTLLSQGR